ncbi:YXWGXW repeat-containing protein [Filimonas lacunae]|nr:YXWGXW repeat-containing protein [Filimonas lacunae]
MMSIGALLLSSCASEVAVTEQPMAPVVVQTAPPYPGAVWIGGEWHPRGRQYYYVQPHYVRPRPSRTWQQGYWRSTPRGHVWQRGHWR